MSQFQARYSTEAKRAVGLAQLDHGLTAREALAALAARQLAPDGSPAASPDRAVSPPAATMPKSTAHDCARRIRLEREGRRGGLENRPPDVARDEMRRRLVLAADRLTRRVERRSANGTADGALAELLTKAARAAAAVDAYMRAGERTPPPTSGKDTPKPEAPAARTPLEEIGAVIARRDRSSAAAARDPQPTNGSSAPT
jgi:hypothetical protein